MANVILIIVPDLPPNINGLGDYAYLLANEFKICNNSYSFEFIVAGNTNYPNSEYKGFRVHTLRKNTCKELFNLIHTHKAKIIHLHYVGYGYAKRGAPLWLLLALSKWVKINENSLITTFHELYASSIIPWTSSFWNQLVQKYICKKVYLISRISITSRKAFANILLSFSSSKKIFVSPVFSNLGELFEFNILIERKKNLVILGSLHTRKFIYNRYSNEISEICIKLNLESIIDIGPYFGQMPKLNVPIFQTGILSDDGISEILKNNLVGLIGSYSSKYFAKSGVFAAYASHAMLIVALNVDSNEAQDGLILNQHFISKENVDFNNENIRNTAYNWYMNHSLKKSKDLYDSIYASLTN